MTGTEAGATIGTQSGIQIILTLVSVVNLLVEAVASPLAVVRTGTLKQSYHCRIGDTVGSIPQTQILAAAATCCHLETNQAAQAVILILECRVVTQVVTSGELE